MGAVGKVYAKALFELGKENGELEKIHSELKSFSDLSRSHPALERVLSGGGFNANDRRAVLQQLLQSLNMSGVVRALLELLVARGRFVSLPSVLMELESLIETSQGVQVGQVRSAVELSADELSLLGSALSKRVGSKVKLSQTVDPSLLGGVVATVSGKTFDASLRSQLDRFKNELI